MTSDLRIGLVHNGTNELLRWPSSKYDGVLIRYLILYAPEDGPRTSVWGFIPLGATGETGGPPKSGVLFRIQLEPGESAKVALNLPLLPEIGLGVSLYSEGSVASYLVVSTPWARGAAAPVVADQGAYISYGTSPSVLAGP